VLTKTALRFHVKGETTKKSNIMEKARGIGAGGRRLEVQKRKKTVVGRMSSTGQVGLWHATYQKGKTRAPQKKGKDWEKKPRAQKRGAHRPAYS